MVSGRKKRKVISDESEEEMNLSIHPDLEMAEEGVDLSIHPAIEELTVQGLIEANNKSQFEYHGRKDKDGRKNDLKTLFEDDFTSKS